MDMKTEGPAVLCWMDDQFTRVKYGHPDYRDRPEKDRLDIETECLLAEKRSAWIQEEHCASWVNNQRERVTA